MIGSIPGELREADDVRRSRARIPSDGEHGSGRGGRLTSVVRGGRVGGGDGRGRRRAAAVGLKYQI